LFIKAVYFPINGSFEKSRSGEEIFNISVISGLLGSRLLLTADK
jgi:hypothetical protein